MVNVPNDWTDPHETKTDTNLNTKMLNTTVERHCR